MMSARQQWAVTLAILLVVSASLAWGARHVKDEIFPATIGVRASQFKAITIDQTPRTRDFAEYKGQVVLLNIWATWCSPCVREMPSIEALYKDYGPKGLKVVAVSIDDSAAIEQVRSFVAAKGLTFDVLLDNTGEARERYQASAVPETFLIARDGSIRKKMTGQADWNSPANRAVIDVLLAEKAP